MTEETNKYIELVKEEYEKKVKPATKKLVATKKKKVNKVNG